MFTGGAVSYRPFGEARDFAHGLDLGGKDAWVSWAKTSDRPADIPANPPPIYRKDWIGWRDWLGIEIDSLSGFRDLREARSFGRSLKLKSVTEWRLWVEANDLPPAHSFSTTTRFTKDMAGTDGQISSDRRKPSPPIAPLSSLR